MNPRDFVEIQILVPLPRCSLRFYVSNELPGEAPAAGPWTKLGVARF